jgi:hypothetical protein
MKRILTTIIFALSCVTLANSQSVEVKERKIIEYLDGRRECIYFVEYIPGGIIIEKPNPDGSKGTILVEVRGIAYRGMLDLPPLQPGQENTCSQATPAKQIVTIEMNNGKMEMGFLLQQDDKIVVVEALPLIGFRASKETIKLRRKDIKEIYLIKENTSTSSTGITSPVVYMYKSPFPGIVLTPDYHRFGCPVRRTKEITVPAHYASKAGFPCEICKPAYLGADSKLVDPLKNNPDLEKYEWMQAILEPSDDSAQSLSGQYSAGGNSRPLAGTDVYVRGHYRKDGVWVRPHTRSSPSSRGRTRR